MWIEIAILNTMYEEYTSPSARKVWIEITDVPLLSTHVASPSARKVWIEISKSEYIARVGKRHLPQGRCGLK